MKKILSAVVVLVTGLVLTGEGMAQMGGPMYGPGIGRRRDGARHDGRTGRRTELPRHGGRGWSGGVFRRREDRPRRSRGD